VGAIVAVATVRKPREPEQAPAAALVEA
jgi:hypothetical protein